MPAQILLPPGWSPPIGYANGIATPPGSIVFIAGQVGWDAQQHFASEDLVPQFEQALKNVLAVLAEAGGEPRHICRMTAYCIDKPAYLAGRRELGHIWRRLMGEHYPAMSMIFVADLLDAPGKVELEATAVIPLASEHHPDFQRAASEAVGRSGRQKRDRYTETEHEQTGSLVAKIADKR